MLRWSRNLLWKRFGESMSTYLLIKGKKLHIKLTRYFVRYKWMVQVQEAFGKEIFTTDCDGSKNILTTTDILKSIWIEGNNII